MPAVSGDMGTKKVDTPLPVVSFQHGTQIMHTLRLIHSHESQR
eukprot:CAMPEP_0204009574 /NCGR_PEP_ID=MMETSP0360-20130528/21939_1 /ASSEMBLY_ACC=CAM_ASM_000342 /TAXON_ID=268821 /ORGANISM="Scrippsiella Hangoei, Strain SHTV-5" /LENGTH=42 /DNA_ID= /DNA_START= /DNA_END= /DNA_ORIENTATION=